MSHLQPRFIAKAKASVKKSQLPQRMPNRLIQKEAERQHCTVQYGFHVNEATYQRTFFADHRLFTLRK